MRQHMYLLIASWCQDALTSCLDRRKELGRYCWLKHVLLGFRVRIKLGRNHVALSAYSADEPSGRWVFQFAAQIVDVDIDNVCRLCGFEVPNRLKQFNPGNALAAIQQEMFEQREFLVGEHNLLAVVTRLVFHSIQFEVPGAQNESR